MKKALAILIVCLMLAATGMPALAESTGTFQPFVVGSTTAMNGSFFTGMWGNNTSDIDVRALLHSYSPVVWSMQSLFEINPTVVTDVVVGILDNGNKMYTISLAQDLQYNDGTPITAKDYAFSLLLHASPEIKEIGGNITSVIHIGGYEEYASGASNIFAGVAVINDYTLGIEINQEYLPFFYELGMLDCYPYPISVIAPGCEIADDGTGAYIRNIDQTVTEPIFNATLLQETILNPSSGYLSNPKVTSGPYQLDSFDSNAKEATFSINTNFKGDHTGQKPQIPELKFVNVKPETMIDDLQTRRVHLLNKCVAGETIEAGLKLLESNEAMSGSYPRTGFGFIAFDCSEGSGPAQFQAVRQAVAYSIDVTAFTERFTSLNYGIPVYGYYGIGQWMVQMILSAGTRPEAASAEETAAWDELSLAGLNTYEPDAEAAKQLLIADGWTLNANGEEFVEGTDDVRYKQVDGQLMELSLNFGMSQGSIAAVLLEEMLTAPLAEIGVKLVPMEIEFTNMLRGYYDQDEVDYDMIYMATNFLSIFDPYFTYNTDPEFAGEYNTSGLLDTQLEALALDMRQTEPGDLLGYIQKWLAFQTYWNDVLPMVPLYSNLYFDFFVPELQGYYPSSQMNWSNAIIYAYLGDAADAVQAQAEDLGTGDAADPTTTIEDE